MELGQEEEEGSSCSSKSYYNCSEKEEERVIIISQGLKPPEPCLLCGEPAVSYDVEGNVIKRENPSGLLKTDDKCDSSSFMQCIFKCFRVDEGRSHRRGDYERWRNLFGTSPRRLPPVCEACEELVVLLLEMYDKVEELEKKIRGKTREAERKFLEEELYRHQSQGDRSYGALRGLLLGGGEKQQNAQQQVWKKTGGRGRTRSNKLDEAASSSVSVSVERCDDILLQPKKAKLCSRRLTSKEPLGLRDPLFLDKQSETIISETQPGGRSIIRRVSRRNRQMRINYAESSSSSSSSEGDKEADAVYEAQVQLATEESSCSSSESPKKVKVAEVQFENKGESNLLMKANNKRASLTKSSNKVKTRQEKNEETGGTAQRRLGRPRRRRPSSSSPPPNRTRRNDKISRIDPTTGNFSYTYTQQARRRRSSSSSAPPSAPSSKKTTTLEFVKQADGSYSCTSCSNTVSFKSDDSIDRLPLYNHARLFHPAASGGQCPVCAKPLLSLRNWDYFNHRLSHLSQSETEEAEANPIRKGRVSYPRIPPLPTRRRITPESAPLHGDVNQCPSCGKFIANGMGALWRHEKTHLENPLLEYRTHLCATCGAAFTTKYNLDIHIIQNHGGGGGGEEGKEGEGEGRMNKLYKCQVCKKRTRLFKTEKALEAHMRKDVHDGGAGVI